MDTTNSSEKPQRRVKHGQRPTEPLADWPAEFGAAGAEQPAATSGDAPADLTMYQAQSEFSDYFSKNYPMDTIIADPDWHSTKIWQAAMSILGRVERIEPATASGDERADFEAWHRSKFAKKHCTGQPTRDMHNGVYAEQYSPEYQQLMWEAWQARAAVSAATKPTADLSSLTVYEFSAFDDGKRQQYLNLADVQSLLATKPAAPADQSIIGKLLDGFSEIEHLWGLNEPGALVRHRDVFNLIVAVGKAADPASPTDAPADHAEKIDAARYRYLRGSATDIGNVIDKEFAPGKWECRAGKELDAAIDAAMSKSAAPEGAEGAK